jgi:phenylacetate-CoA ligase
VLSIKNFTKLLAVPWASVGRVVFTSGTTGEPKVMAYSFDEISQYEKVGKRLRKTFAAHPVKVAASLVPYELSGIGLFLGTTIERALGATHVPLGLHGSRESYLHIIKELNVDSIFTIPSIAYQLSNVAAQCGFDIHQLGIKNLVLTGEAISRNYRKRLEDLWNCETYMLYGMTEFMSLGYECVAKNGYHINSDRFLFEIITENSDKNNSRPGNILITTLQPRAIPLIRYVTGDCGRIEWSVCECGSTLPRIYLMGRIDEAITIAGAKIYPVEIENALYSVTGIRVKYQIIIKEKGNIDGMTILVETDSTQEDKLKEQIVDRIINSSIELGQLVSEGSMMRPDIKLVPKGSLVGFDQVKSRRIIDKRKHSPQV